MILDYGGDDPSTNRIVSWFQMQLRAIGVCLSSELPEAALVMIYSGIDTFGLLAAPATVQDAGRDTFKEWCEKYILPRLQAFEGGAINSIDLYAARCGVLHTSTPLSALERTGKAHQFWYHLDGKAGANLIMNSTMPLLGIDIMNLATAFKEGGIAFMIDINQDAMAFQVADARSQHFLRWGNYVAEA